MQEKIRKKHNTNTAIKKVNRIIKNHMYFITDKIMFYDFETGLNKIQEINNFDLNKEEIVYNTNRSLLKYLYDIYIFLNSILIYNKQYIKIENMQFVIKDY